LVDQPLRAPARQLWPRAGDEPYSTYERRRRLRVVALVVLLVIVVGAVFGTLVLRARDNYIAGQRALAAGQYGLAIQRLSAANVAGRPWANAHALLDQAVTLSMGRTQYATALQGAARPTAASLTLRRAATLFEAGRYAQAQAALADLPSRVPPAAAARLSAAGSPAAAAVLLLVGAAHALAAGDLRTATSDAATVLARYPGCVPARSLIDEAARRQRAAPFDSRAATLAAAGRWKLARTAVRRALAIDPAYPGAAALLARIDAAITRRAAAAKAKAAAAAAAASTSTTPPATTAPAPAPAPAPPPP